MKRTVVTATVIGLALSGAGLASAKPGNGAQKAGVAAASGNSFTGCTPPTAQNAQSAATGFAVLNAPGKPGMPKKVVGTVSLKSATPGTYDLNLVSPGGSSCGTRIGQLVVGPNGQGSASVASPGNGAGQYYVVLTQPYVVALLPGAAAKYASVPVTLR